MSIGFISQVTESDSLGTVTVRGLAMTIDAKLPITDEAELKALIAATREADLKAIVERLRAALDAETFKRVMRALK